MYLAVSAVIHIAVVVVPLTFLAIGAVASWAYKHAGMEKVFGPVPDKVSGYFRKRSKRRLEDRRTRTERAIDAMLCQPMPHEVTFGEVDRSVKTTAERVRLRVQEYKAKPAVCAPYEEDN